MNTTSSGDINSERIKAIQLVVEVQHMHNLQCSDRLICTTQLAKPSNQYSKACYEVPDVLPSSFVCRSGVRWCTICVGWAGGGAGYLLTKWPWTVQGVAGGCKERDGSARMLRADRD